MNSLVITPPKYQLMSPLLNEDFEALKLDISLNGVLVPVETDDAGAILDGHHRVRACLELGISQYPKIIRSGMTEEEKRRHARRLNIARRQLSPEDKRDIIRDQIREEPTKSARQIAWALGISHHTVMKVRREMEDVGTIAHVEHVVDTLGRKQPINRQRAVYVDDTPEGRSAAILRGQEIFEQNKKTTGGGQAVGTRTDTKEARGDDFYETPRCATVTILELEKFSPVIWGPACGRSALHSVCEERGYEVELSDLRDRGAVTRHGECARVEDFLTSKSRGEGLCPDIVENIPFAIANEFIAHALKVHRPRKMAFLLNHGAMCGFDNDDRNLWMEEFPPSRVYVFSRRLPMMHRDGYEGKKSGSQMNCMWAVWEMDEHGNLGTNTATRSGENPRTNSGEHAPAHP